MDPFLWIFLLSTETQFFIFTYTKGTDIEAKGN